MLKSLSLFVPAFFKVLQHRLYLPIKPSTKVSDLLDDFIPLLLLGLQLVVKQQALFEF